LQKSLPDSKAARGLTPHDEEDEEAAAGDGEARTSAASAHAGIASRTGETTGGQGLRAAAEALGWGASEQERRFRRLFGLLRLRSLLNWRDPDLF